MAIIHNILVVEIDGVIVEKIRVFTPNELRRSNEMANDLKKAYNLSAGDNYSIYLKLQSKMNDPKFDPVFTQYPWENIII